MNVSAHRAFSLKKPASPASKPIRAMTTQQLYALLELPAEVIQRLNEYEQNDPPCIGEDVLRSYLCRSTSKDGLEALQRCIGEDPDGMKQLRVLLQIAADVWDSYESRGISQPIYVETMKFVTRFLHAYHQQHGVYRFVWGWWFWRQLAMQEYRVGCMEYELVEESDGRRFISLHIPSDADLRPEAIDDSFEDFRVFLQAHYPDWTEAPWCCDSWLLSPALKHLLPEGSNIRAFQERFVIEHTDEDSLGVLNWVFPPHTSVSDELPERTSLQKRMKAWLLSGNKVGWTRGTLRHGGN